MNLKRQLYRYIIPNSLAMVGMSCYILADLFFISAAAGSDGIAAVNFSMPVYSLIFAIGSMIGTGFAIRYTLAKGTKESESEKMFSYAVEWEILISLIFVLLGIVCPDKVFKIMGANDEILKIGALYLRIVLLFAPCFMLNYTFTAFVRNDYAPKLAMAATLSSSIFNIVFDYVLMFPLKMGMAGAALATGFSPAVSMLVCMVHYLSKKNTIVFRPVFPSVLYLIHACQVGISYFIGEIATGITTIAFNYILLGLAGNTAVAAYGVIANIALVATALFNGISQGQQPLLSELHTQRNLKGEKIVFRYSLQIALAAAICIIAVVCIFKQQCIDIFNGEKSELLQIYAVKGLPIYFTGFLFASVNIIKAGYFSAAGAAKEAFIIALSRGVVSIIVFAFVLSEIWGITGVWLAFPAAELFTFLITLLYKKENNGQG